MMLPLSLSLLVMMLPLSFVSNVEFHPAVFDSITAETIRKSALYTQGAAGPSGMDALSWRRLCTAFGEKSIITYARLSLKEYVLQMWIYQVWPPTLHVVSINAKEFVQ